MISDIKKLSKNPGAWETYDFGALGGFFFQSLSCHSKKLQLSWLGLVNRL